ncbi:hypothetical protein H2200_003337 [Cladophialophora chaetospira]|uniref:Zn(2)-C6 fungal-type domain-containing protein n=1 Tax=Cladophialophora chaetospira TaxID=386627 RepID=A0AA38XH64_9EURO|nr:hypothetical protein H2200_003337 [Cladophialophora chaetospira]
MSGSPPPEPPAETPQIAGRRRKRSHTPPTTTAATLPPITPSDTTAPRAAALLRGGETLGEVAVQPGPYALNYPAPPTTYQAASSLLPSSVGVQEPRFALSPISPRATRKPKAHVASACVNCKKKHLRCDSSRPCRRCVQSGKEDSCHDVEHKKRGRPPLKPDDTASTGRYPPTPSYQPTLPAVSQSIGRPNFSSPSPYSQGSSYTPILPSLTPWIPRSQQGPPSYYPSPAQPSISPSLATAEGTFIPSSTGQYGRPMLQPASPYGSRADPSLHATGYTSYNYPPPQGQMGRPYYSNPIFPPHPPTTLPPEHLAPLHTSTALQLPPIQYQAPSGLIDPAIVQQQRPPSRSSPQGEHESRSDGTQEPGAKRPKMDIKGILDPRND